MNSFDRIFNSINEAKNSKPKGKPKSKPTAAERAALVAKHGEKVGNAMADRMNVPKKGMQTESSHMRNKKGLVGKQHKLDIDKNGKLTAKDFRMLRGESKEIIDILDLIKEAYQEELISEEAFLAIADPIIRSLIKEQYEEDDSDDEIIKQIKSNFTVFK